MKQKIIIFIKVFLIGLTFLFSTVCGNVSDGDDGTNGGGDDNPTVLTLPTVVSTTTPDNVDITKTTITISGNVTDAGNDTITARGVAWGTEADPTINGSETEEEENTFTSTIPNLLSDTTYHFRVYATNSVGTGYGASQEFTTLAAVLSGTTFVRDVGGTVNGIKREIIVETNYQDYLSVDNGTNSEYDVYDTLSTFRLDMNTDCINDIKFSFGGFPSLRVSSNGYLTYAGIINPELYLGQKYIRIHLLESPYVITARLDGNERCEAEIRKVTIRTHKARLNSSIENGESNTKRVDFTKPSTANYFRILRSNSHNGRFTPIRVGESEVFSTAPSAADPSDTWARGTWLVYYKWQPCFTSDESSCKAKPSPTFSLFDSGARFTKIRRLGAIGNNGGPLPLDEQFLPWSDSGTEDTGGQWGCVEDNTTGLTWETKTVNNRHWDMQYLDVYHGYVDAINDSNLCSYNDWRIPTEEELYTLIYCSHDQSRTDVIPNFDVPNAIGCGWRSFSPTVDTGYFPNMGFGDLTHWTSTLDSRGLNAVINFRRGTYGGRGSPSRRNYHSARLVRGTYTRPSN